MCKTYTPCFTLKLVARRARLIPGDTYINRGFLLSSDLGSVKSTAENLVEKTYIAKVAPQDYTPRSIDIYTTTNNTHLVSVPEGTLKILITYPVGT